MYLLYADDAGNTGTDYDNKQQPIFNLAGVVVPAEQWHDLNRRVESLRLECFPGNAKAEFHATYIYNGSNDKKAGISFHDIGFKDRLNILSKVIDLIVGMSLPIIHFTVRKHNLKEYCRYAFNNAVKIDPYFVAMPYLLSYFDDFLKNRGTYGIVFLDEQRELRDYFDVFEKRIRVFFADRETINIDNIIEKAVFLDSSKSSFIQLADVVNFFITRKMLLDHRGCNYSREQDQFVLDMFNKLSPLIVPPPFDPTTRREPLRFIWENGNYLKQKEQPTP